MSIERDVFLFIYESGSVTPDLIADEFDIDKPEDFLTAMAEDSDAIEEFGKNGGYWRVRNVDELNETEVMAVAMDAFGAPDSTSDVPATPAVETPTQSPTDPAPVDVPDASEAVSEAADRSTRARDNFSDLAQNAPTEVARSFWQAKLDSLPPIA